MWLCSGKGERLGYKRSGFNPTVAIFFLFNRNVFNNKFKWHRTFTKAKFATKSATPPQDAKSRSQIISSSPMFV